MENEFLVQYLLTCDNKCPHLLKCYGKFDALMISEDDFESTKHTKGKVDEFLQFYKQPRSKSHDSSIFIVMDEKPCSLIQWCIFVFW